MSSKSSPVIPLSGSTEIIEQTHSLMIIRNMAGQDAFLMVSKSAIVWDVRHHLAMQLGLTSSEIHLMLNYNVLEDTTQINTILPLLEERGHIVDILVEEEEMPPLEYHPNY